jgi:hypothetical protein
MALVDKNIVITPNIGAAADPKIVFSGADATTSPQNVTMQAYPNSNGTLSIDGSVGQLFSVTSSMTGTIFSANDISGIPSIEVLDTGLVKLAQYNGNVTLGSTTATSSVDIGNGATLSGSTKTITVGSNGVAGSTTTVSVGSSAGTSNIDLYGNVLVKSATGALGYGAGSGGTVTQTTNRNTAVTINKLSGTIVMSGTNNVSEVDFIVNNSLVGVNDTIIITQKVIQNIPGIGGADTNLIIPRIVSAGVFKIYFTMYSPVNEVTTLNFTIIKGSAT